MKIFCKMAVVMTAAAMLQMPEMLYGVRAAEWEFDELDLKNEQRVTSFTDTDQTPFTDEEFYGQYDKIGEEWVKEGYLDYDGFDGLCNVRAAAKDGDYERAKYELLEFFREFYKDFGDVYTSVTPTAHKLYSAYAIKNNFQLNTAMIPAVLGVPKLGNEDGYAELDITPYMDSILDQPEPVLTIELFGLRKDGTSLVFESRNANAGHPPVAEVTSKGVTQIITATDDATISPKENYATNYGHEPTLCAEESVSSIELERLTDSATKRALVKFDFSSVDSETTPTRAVVKLYGRNASGVGSGELLAIRFSFNSWNEDEVTFYKGQQGITMEHATFSSYGLDSFRFDGGVAPDVDGGTQVFAYRYPEELLRFTWSPVLAELYHYDHDERYALTFLNQWIGYLNQRGRYPRYDKTLDGHCRDRDVPQALYEFINSEYMTPDIWSATMKYYQMEMRAQIDGGNDSGNWGSYQINGMIALAGYARPLKIYDEIINVLKEWVPAKIDEAFRPDGSGKEIEWGYSFGTFLQLFQGEQLLRRTRVPDRVFPDDIQDKGYKIVKYFASLLLPGGGNPQVGDGAGYLGKSYNNETRNKMLYDVLDIPFWKYLATGGKEGTPPDWTTIRYSGSDDPENFVSGVYIMRTDWGDEAIYLYTDVDGNSNPGHGHADDNQIIVKAYGQYLLTDQSFTSYASNRVPLDTTKYHNTVCIDEQTQNHSGVTAFEVINPVKKEKRYVTNSIYDNTMLTTPQNGDFYGLHTRNILFLKSGYWIVNDYLEPTEKNKSHNYQQNWHMLPAADPTMDYEGIGRSNFDESANIIIAQADMDGITASVEPGYFGQGTGALYDSHYLHYERSTAGNVTYDTVIYPSRPGENARIDTYALPVEDVSERGARAMHLNITSDTGTYVDADYYIVNDEAQKIQRKFGKYVTDGHSAYAERDARSHMAKLIVQDASVLYDGDLGRTLFSSPQKTGEFAYEKESYILKVTASDDAEENGATIYLDDAADIKEVILNGQSVSFGRNGHYIYFGSTPEIDEKEKEADKEQQPDGSSSGSGSSGSSSSGGGSSGGGAHAAGAGYNGARDRNMNVADIKDNKRPSDAFAGELSDHWGGEELLNAIDDGIIKGYENGRLLPDNSITRAELTAVLTRALGIGDDVYTDEFYDVKGESWYAGCVAAAYKKGIVSGYGDGMFMPENEVTREEMAKMLAVIYENAGHDTERSGAHYADESEMSDWAREYIYAASDAGILRGTEDNTFSPHAHVTRAEAAVAALRIKNIIRY